MNCPICDGNLENKLVNICACDELPPVVVRGVPALVCERCEEKVLTQESIDVIATVRGGGAPPPIIAQYSLYDYQNLKTGIPLNFGVANIMMVGDRSTFNTRDTRATMNRADALMEV